MNSGDPEMSGCGGGWWRKGRAAALACLMSLALVAGCAKPAGPVFELQANALRWPGPPEPPRIVHVGQLATSADLKPSKKFMQGFGEALFGKKTVYTMLSPYALCTDNGSRVFVADNNGQLVHVFDLESRQYQQWRPEGSSNRLTQPVGIAWDPAGRLLVADSLAGVIFVFNAQGQYAGEYGRDLLQRPCGLAIDPSTRRIFVADVVDHQVVVFSPEGQLLQRIGQRGSDLGQFNYPTNVAVDAQGRLYVSDSLNFRIQQFGPDLKPVRQIGSLGNVPGFFSQPKGIALDREGHLYVVDSRFENVQIFDAEGQLLLDFGEEGRGPGQFWLPAGIFIDANNRIWIADTYNRRVAVFDYLPEKQP